MLRSRRLAKSRCRAALWTALAALACAAPRASAEATAPAELERRIAEVDALLAGAHFHTALALARSALDRLPAAAAPGEGPARARLELMAATAEVALGRREAARLSLERAARADPTLVFDPRELSPKLMELAPQPRRELLELPPQPRRELLELPPQARRRAGAPEDPP